MTYRTGSIGEFARWTKRVVADPKAAKGEPKHWFETDETAAGTQGLKTSPEALVKLLSEDNLELLRVIYREKPASMQALANLVGRRQSNLSRTLKKLADAGIVRLDPGPNRTVSPTLLARRVTLDLDLAERKGRILVDRPVP